MSIGRIETYVHSDCVTENKVGCMVLVRAQTDFAAKTDEFKEFSEECAKVFCWTGASDWQGIVDYEEEYTDALVWHKERVEKLLGEKITVEEIVHMKL